MLKVCREEPWGLSKVLCEHLEWDEEEVFGRIFSVAFILLDSLQDCVITLPPIQERYESTVCVWIVANGHYKVAHYLY